MNKLTRILLTIAVSTITFTLYAATEVVKPEVAVEEAPKDPVKTDEKAKETAKTTHENQLQEIKPGELTTKPGAPAGVNDKFIPTESISEDLAVSFPVDI
jgi:hypothetical protein